MIDTTYLELLAQKYHSLMGICPEKGLELSGLLQDAPPDFVLLAKALYAQMPITDIISLPCEIVLEHVGGVWQALADFDYGCAIPPEIFAHFVLPYRINDENFEPYNRVFMKELAPFVHGKSLEQAALAVNYRCMAMATYRCTDDRTASALTVARIGYGRCGEESVLAVSALRSVGIPARQCYVPFWAHCDDNHAWVEVWTGKSWCYMGACEPEEHMNTGWFNHAASKAPIVRHRVFGKGGNRLTSMQNDLFVTHATTKMYAETRTLTVHCAPNTLTGIYIINYGKPSLLQEQISSRDGCAVFELGIGDYLVFAGNSHGYDCRAIDLSTQNEIALDLSSCPKSVIFDLHPPKGRLPEIAHSLSPRHFEKIRIANAFRQEHMLCENPNISDFLSNSDYTSAQKQQVLDTLTDKDKTDISLDVLEDMALFPCPCGNDIFQKYILPIRVENEYLSAHRDFAKQFFGVNAPKSPAEIYDYLQKNINTADALAYAGLVADLKSVLQYKITTQYALPIHFVQLCRAFGFAARLNPIDRSPEFWNGTSFAVVNPKDEKTGAISICGMTGVTTVSALRHGSLCPLNIESGALSIPVNGGVYALCSADRQIDGSMVGTLQFAVAGQAVVIPPNADKTLDALKNFPIVLKKPFKNKLSHLIDGKCILSFVESGTEPTSHFLNELWENQKLLRDANISTAIIGALDPCNPSVKRVLDDCNVVLCSAAEDNLLADLRGGLDTYDERLPFIAAIRHGHGLYAFANYNVGTVKTIINILQ